MTEDTAAATYETKGKSGGTSDNNILYDWYIVAVLFIVSVIGYVDRAILSFLVEPIKADLLLNDAQMGAVTGMAFALLYVFGGIFIGRWLDRGHKVAILAGCILLWSLATASSGLAVGFISLFVARMFVGVGEAGLNPAALGIISNRFTPDKVQKPIGLFTTGVYIGGGLAMLLGAKLLAYFTSFDFGHLAFLPSDAPWRSVFVFLAVPGILVALLLLLTVRDKPAVTAQAAGGASQATAWAYAKDNKHMLIFLVLGFVAWSMNNYSLLNWYPAMLMRVFEMSPTQVAGTYGPAFLIAGTAGCLAIYPFNSWLKAFYGNKAAHYVCVFSMAALALFSIIGPLMPNADLAILMAYVTLFFSSASVAAIFVLIVVLVPPGLRSFYTGLYMALVNLTGGAFGAVLVGALSDHVYGASGLHLAVSTVAVIFAPLSALFLFLASRHFRAA